MVKLPGARHLIWSTSLAALSFAFAPSALAQPVAANAGAEPEEEAEIVINATRRAESARDVPISVTALTGEELRSSGVTSTRDLALVTPGLRMDQSGTYVQPAIRGVTTLLTASNEANVATYIDNVYQPSLLGAIHELPDVRQVEVLKGPQGTLFGRNATGGAILISTIDPDLDEVVGKLSLGYSSFKTVTNSAFISVPLVKDKLAISLTGFYENMSDGYKRNLLRGGKRDGADVETGVLRAKIRFRPSDGIEFVLSGMYADRDDDNILKNSNYQGNNARRNQAAAANPPVPIADEPHEYASDLDPFTNTKIQSVSLRGSIDVGPGTLTSTTAYLRNDQRLVTDGDNSPFPNSAQNVAAVSKTFTQELLYSTKQLGAVRGVLGFFYFNQDSGNAPFWLNIPGTGATYVSTIWTPDKIKAYAFFGEGVIDISDRIAFTAGVRYSHEKKKQYSLVTSGPAEPAVIPLLGEKSWNSLDPRLSLLFKLNPDINLYATFSKGFKSGAFSPPNQINAVDPEKITAFEIGFKGRFASWLTLNGAAFYYDYKDLQVTSIETINGQHFQRLTNASEARIKGAELSGTARVAKDFRLSFGLAYLDAEYSYFPNAVFTTPQPNGTIISDTGDVTGNRMIRSPKWTANLSAQYGLDTEIGRFEFSGTLFLSSRVYFDPNNRIVQPSYGKLNAALSWQPDSNHDLSLRVWAKNITNSDSLASLVASTSYDAVTWEPPRSFGVDLRYNF